MNQFGAIETGRKDRIMELFSQAHNLGNGGDHAQALALFDQASEEFCGRIEQAIEAGPDNAKIIALWKNTNATRRQLELPYIFPAGLGRAQMVDGISGYLSKGDLEALRYCAVNSKGKSVNIGVFDGSSTYFVAKNNPNLEVYGIDAYLGMNAQNTKVDHEHALKAKQNLSRLENAHLIVGLSSDIAQSWRDKIGFLFVDGNHSAEGAIADFIEWSPFVSAGGLIAVHDAYRRVSQTIYKIRQRDNSHGPDIICQRMENDPNYEFVKVSGCTEVWRKRSRAVLTKDVLRVNQGLDEFSAVLPRGEDKHKIYEGLNKCYFSKQCHEKEIIEHLPELLDGVEVFVDVGASLGQYTFFANKHMNEGEIFAIEADSIRFEELKRNCRKWECLSSNKLTALFAAICEKDGKETFYATNSTKSGGLFKRAFGSESANWCENVVDSFRLDSLFKDSSPDFVKIDVEGAELRVLKGATRILSEGKTSFLIEVHSGVDPEGQRNPAEVFKFMESFGYSYSNFHGRYLFFKKETIKENIPKYETENTDITVEELRENFRTTIIDLGLETVSTHSAPDRLNALEVGCMFKTNEGLSTYRIAHFIQQLRGQRRFISIDSDSEHIDACKQMLCDFAPALLSEVKFLCGNSLEMLPKALNEMQSVDFALLDGGAGPECCLREFELVAQSLSENGLVIIDDLQDMEPTEAYPFPRLFGKGTLILPYMVIAEYMKVRDISRSKKGNFSADPTKASSSYLIAQTPSSELLKLLGNLRYLIIAKGSHKMMVVGKHSILESFQCLLAAKRLSSVEIVPTGYFVNAPSNINRNNNFGNAFAYSQSLSCDNTITLTEEQPLANRRNLEIFANKYVGRRAFIIGNGPSLNKMDLTKLKDEITFGVNNIFYLIPKIGFKPTFYVVEDKLVAEDRAEEINTLTGMIKIFGTELQYCLKDSPDLIWTNVIYDFSNYPDFPHFSEDASQCIWVGGTVSYLCMQLAYYMGFNEVYLIGFDHNYVIPTDANVDGTIITSVSDDPNHFHPGYFGKGRRWHDPKLDRMEKAYTRAKEVFEAHGKKIFNATVGGKLEIFPRVNYESLFAKQKIEANETRNTANAGNEKKSAIAVDSGGKVQQIQNHLAENKITTQRNPQFSHLVLDYTRMCNSRCTYCGIWRMKNGPELSLEAIERIFSGLRPYGLSTCYVTGGEPYISDKVVDIARLLHKYLPKCKLSGATNGIQPEKILKHMQKILEMGISLEVHVSINGDEATHDATRGEPGYWKKAVYLLETLKSAGVPVVASMSLMPQTIADLSYMQRFCAERDIRLMFSWVRQWERYGSVDKEHSTWPERMKSRLREIEYLPDTFDCPGLSKRLVVTPDGSVYPCEVYNPKILLGNVNERSLESMLASSRTDSIARLIAERGCTWCQGPGEVDGSPKWMLMDCYRRHSEQYAHLAKQFPQVVNMAPEESCRVIESILSEKTIRQIPTAIMQQSTRNKIGDKNNVRISAVICTYRNPELLTSAIEKLINQTLRRDLFEIIVVDNNSGDSTKQVVEQYPGVRYVLEEKLGLSRARNSGIRAACGDIIAFIDDDAEACRGWLAALLRVYDAVPEAWAVGGKVLPIWDAEKPEWLTEEYYRSLSLLEWGEVERALHWPERIIGTNCSFRREVFAESGDFDTCLGRLGSYMLSFEDTEVQHRIHEIRHLVYYTPKAVVHHHVPAWRMTEEYMDRRTLGNTLSEMFIVLRDGGKGEEARRFVDRFHDMASEFTDESEGPIEAQIMGRVYSEFMQGLSDVPAAIKAKFARILGRYYSQRGRFEEAERRFTEGLILDGLGDEQACKILVELGKVYLNQDRYDEAEQKFEKAMSLGVAEGETMFDMLKGLGACCGQRGCFTEMAKRFDEILALGGISEKKMVDAMRCFGRYYFKHQKYTEAAQLYTRMLGKVQGRGRYHALKGLGASYCMQGRVTEMSRILDEILTSGNISVECKVDAALSFAKYYSSCGKYEEVKQLCLRVIGQARGKDKYHLLKTLESYYEVQGRYSEAEKKFSEAASTGSIDPEEQFWIVVGLAKCELAQDRYAEARRRYEKLFSNNHCPNQQKVVLAGEFANYHAARGQHEKVVEIYKRVCCLKGLLEKEKTAFVQMAKDAISKIENDRKQEDSKMKEGSAIGSSIRISVVVCTHRNPLLLNKTLESLSVQTIGRGLYEVIVVDNNSGDSTKQVVDHYPEVRYVFEENLGLSHARNTGVQAARGDIIAFIDDDAEASAGWLEALLKIYEAIPDVWAVGGKVLPIWDAAKPDWITEDKFRQLSLVDWGNVPRALGWPERIIGTNCSFRRQVFTDIGFFDTGLGRIGTVLLGNEDTEIQQRIHALGHSVYYTPDAVVHHHVPASRMTREYFKRRSEGTIFSQNIMNLRSQGKDQEVEKINAEIRRKLELSNFAQKQQQVLNASRGLLSQYKDRHRGQRCVIIGNGPSLNKMDLSFLKNEITFGMNRIYLLFDKWDFRPTYYVSVNPLVIEQSTEQICKITSPKFLGLNGLPYIRNHQDTIFLQSIRSPSFSKDPRNGLWEGHTVTYVAMQLAYFMGFSEVILIGVDHYFKDQGPANKEVISEGDDQNHFHPHYFGKGVCWNLPDLAKSEAAYSLAKQAFEADGRRIVDATVDGHLIIFPKADYRHIFLPSSLTANRDEPGSNAALIDTEFEDSNRDKNENLNITVRPKSDPLVPAEPHREYLVSAIVSTYNSERFLRGCLDDLEQQTIADKLEIIIVNSGSQENEEAIVREYRQKYSNIVYITTEQREGIYTAWNRAVSMARGTFLTNANTDDRHRKDALEIMAETLLANPDIALVYGDQICTDTPNGTFANHHATEMARRPEYSQERLLFGCCVGSQPMWRKSLHDELGNFDESLACAGDWDFWLRISSKYKFKHILDFMGLYYYNKQGIEHARKIHSLYERYIVGRRYGNPYISVIPLYKSKDNPLVSVIMPAYNAAAHIAEAIESVLIQNYRNLELIVVDDGSIDNTKDIVTGFKDDRIKYFYKGNSGPSGTRNLAISKAGGQYIIPLDADDMMTPDSIARHLIEFENHPDVDLVYCDVLLIDDKSNPIRIMKKPEYQDRRHLIRDLFRAGHPVLPFRLGIRRSVFDKIGFYDEDFLVGEDYDMMRRFVKAGLKAHHLNEPLHLRRMHTDSLSRNFTAQKAKSHFDLVKRFVETFSHDELFPDVEWDEIPADKKQLHAKCLAVVNYLAIGQDFLNSNSARFYANTAFEHACSDLHDCLKIDPDNRQIRELLQKCELGRQRYEKHAKQTV